MKRVGIVESLKYGGRVFVYFLAVVLVGGGGIGLGAVVGWNAASVSVTGGDLAVHDGPELAAGVVLGLLGSAVLFTGLFGIAYKLIADSTAEGTRNAAERRQTAEVESAAGGRASGPADGQTAGEPSPAPGQKSERTTVADGAAADGPASAEGDQSTAGGTDASAAPQPRSGDGGSTTAAADDRNPPDVSSQTDAGTAAGRENEGSAAEEAPAPREASGADPARSPQVTGGTDESETDSGHGTGDVADTPAQRNAPPDTTDGPAAEVDHSAGPGSKEASEGEFRKRTAEQIAFGADQSDEEASKEPDTPVEQRDEGGESGNETAEKDTDNEPAIFTEDRVGEGNEVSDDDRGDVELFEGDGESDDGEAADATVVPEYDEISADELEEDSPDQAAGDGDGVDGRDEGSVDDLDEGSADDGADRSADRNASGKDPLDPFE